MTVPVWLPRRRPPSLPLGCAFGSPGSAPALAVACPRDRKIRPAAAVPIVSAVGPARPRAGTKERAALRSLAAAQRSPARAAVQGRSAVANREAGRPVALQATVARPPAAGAREALAAVGAAVGAQALRWTHERQRRCSMHSHCSSRAFRRQRAVPDAPATKTHRIF